MQDELRDRIKTFLDLHRVGVLSTSGSPGTWAVFCHRGDRGMEVICLLPAWADVSYYIEQDPQVQIVILDLEESRLRWLLINGKARPVPYHAQAGAGAEPPRERLIAFCITPSRIDLFDESRGWGARETLEFE